MISPLTVSEVLVLGYVCLPESVIFHDVPFIVDRKCGAHTAGLVRDYYLCYRTSFNSVLSNMGLPTNICDKETGGKPAIDRVYAASDDTANARTFALTRLVKPSM